MTNSDFVGVFGDFATLVHDTDLSGYNIWKWSKDGSQSLLRIVGYTKLFGDYLLHVVSFEQADAALDTSELLKKYSIGFILLTVLANDYGFSITPIPD